MRKVGYYWCNYDDTWFICYWNGIEFHNICEKFDEAELQEIDENQIKR